MQKTVTDAEVAFSKLLEEKNALALQLEEEKRKCEDLLFRFEEESVNKDDIQVHILTVYSFYSRHKTIYIKIY